MCRSGALDCRYSGLVVGPWGARERRRRRPHHDGTRGAHHGQCTDCLSQLLRRTPAQHPLRLAARVRRLARRTREVRPERPAVRVLLTNRRAHRTVRRGVEASGGRPAVAAPARPVVSAGLTRVLNVDLRPAAVRHDVGEQQDSEQSAGRVHGLTLHAAAPPRPANSRRQALRRPRRFGAGASRARATAPPVDALRAALARRHLGLFVAHGHRASSVPPPASISRSRRCAPGGVVRRASSAFSAHHAQRRRAPAPDARTPALGAAARTAPRWG